MDLLQFSSSVIGSLAWPVAMVILGLLFRQQLRALLGKVKLAKGAGLEFQFTEEAKAVATAVELATQPEKLPAPSRRWSEVHDLGHVLLSGRRTYQTDGVHIERPASMVLTAWADVQTMLYRLLALATSDWEDYIDSPWRVIKQLYDHGFLTQESAEVLQKLLKMRNEVAHVEFEPDPHAALEYAQTAAQMRKLIEDTFLKVGSAE